MTFKANTPDRDDAIRKLAGELSAAIHGQHIDIAIAAAALLIVAQCEPYKNPDLDRYAATKLRQVADVMQPHWVSVADYLPPDETPVLVLRCGAVRIGELRWDHPGHEDSYRSFRYWDDPNDDGQGWEFDEITHWAPIPQPPIGA